MTEEQADQVAKKIVNRIDEIIHKRTGKCINFDSAEEMRKVVQDTICKDINPIKRLMDLLDSHEQNGPDGIQSQDNYDGEMHGIRMAISCLKVKHAHDSRPD